MKSPKEKIAVGVLLVTAAAGLTGCVPGKERRMYTAYGVAAPMQSVLQDYYEKKDSNATEEPAEQPTTEPDVSIDDGGTADSF